MYENVMIDIETTGLVPWVNRITSFAMVPFKIRKSRIQGDGRAPTGARFPPDIKFDRSDNSETMKFREHYNIDTIEANVFDVQPLETIFRILNEWINNKTMLWSKPATFDIIFLQSYYHQFNTPTPWHYRNTRCVNTFVWQLGFDPRELFDNVTAGWPNLEPHNPIHDVEVQVAMLDYALYYSQNKIEAAANPLPPPPVQT